MEPGHEAHCSSATIMKFIMGFVKALLDNELRANTYILKYICRLKPILRKYFDACRCHCKWRSDPAFTDILLELLTI